MGKHLHNTTAKSSNKSEKSVICVLERKNGRLVCPKVILSLSNLTLMGRGAESAHTFFKCPFLHEIMVLKVSDFMTFPNSLKTFRKSNFLLVFHSDSW